MKLVSYDREPSADDIIFTAGNILLDWHTRTGGNMMSIAYDYSREPLPVVAAAEEKLLLIGGRRGASVSGRTFKSINPATEEIIATISEGTEIDVDHAVAAARRAFEGPWRTMRAAERGHILLKWAELLKKHVDEIVEIESLDGGKPIAAALRQDF